MFTLRPGNRDRQRKTKLLISILLPKKYLESPEVQAESLTLTLKNVIESVYYLNNDPHWSRTAWKYIVISIVCDESIGKPALDLLGNIGIYLKVPWGDDVEIGTTPQSDAEVVCPRNVNRKAVKARIFEVH